MKALRERWYVYEIDSKGMLNHPQQYGDYLFSRWGYSTEQEAKDELLNKVNFYGYHGEVSIIKTYQAVEKEDE